MSTLNIEIFTENECVDEFKTASGRVMRSQVAYVYLSGKFPERMKIPLEDGQPFYRAGMYTLDICSFKIGKYDSLEINNFETKLVLIDAKKLSKVG